MTEASRLGRGLGALLAPRPAAGSNGVELPPAGPRYRELPVAALRANARQPRTAFAEDTVAELAASIREVGVLQPIIVREVDAGGFEIVMGERRWRAAQQAGLTSVPVIVRETGDEAMLRDALLENLHREQLNPLDEAAAYSTLLNDLGATHEQLAERVGRSRAHVSNTMRLMALPATVQRRVAAGVLSAGHARALLTLTDPDAQERLAGRAVAEGLSVRSVEEIVAVGEQFRPPRATRRRRDSPPALERVARHLGNRLDTKVLVQAGARKGRLVVEFGSLTDLDRILAELAPDALAVLRSEADDDTARLPPPAADQTR